MIAFPEPADSIPVFPIPFRPADREFTDLIAAFADIPGFRNQLDCGDNGILVDDIEEGRQPVDIMQFPGQGGGQVEAKPSTCISVIQ